MIRFDKTDAVGECNSQQEHKRESEPVMGMEFHFGEQVSQRDTDKDAGREGQGTTNDDMLIGRELLHAEEEQECSQRAHQSKADVNGIAPTGGPSAGGHQGSDRDGIQWFMEANREKRSQSEEGQKDFVMLFGDDAGPKGEAIDQGMQGESECDADPAQVMGVGVRMGVDWSMGMMLFAVMVVIMIVVVVGFFIQFHGAVLMKVKRAQEKEKGDNAGHHPPGGSVDRTHLCDRVRQQMEDADSQHEAADETDERFHSRMGQTHQGGQPASEQRGEDNQSAVDAQQGVGPGGAVLWRRILYLWCFRTGDCFRMRVIVFGSQGRSGKKKSGRDQKHYQGQREQQQRDAKIILKVGEGIHSIRAANREGGLQFEVAGDGTLYRHPCVVIAI